MFPCVHTIFVFLVTDVIEDVIDVLCKFGVSTVFVCVLHICVALSFSPGVA